MGNVFSSAFVSPSVAVDSADHGGRRAARSSEAAPPGRL